jgi:osmoprotectant transport system permease protein
MAAAQAMGLTPGQVFREVEWPLAFPVVLLGVRVALVLAVATAAVGALAGATTLGTPIVIGLQNQNELYVLQGAAATAALAFIAEGLLASVAGRSRTRQGSISSG